MKDLADDPLFRAAFGLLSGKRVQNGAKAVRLDEAEVMEPAGLTPLTPEHFRRICHAEQGPMTCRYLAHTLDGIRCGKVVPAIKSQVDLRYEAGMMRSKGDHCAGRGGCISMLRAGLK